MLTTVTIRQDLANRPKTLLLRRISYRAPKEVMNEMQMPPLQRETGKQHTHMRTRNARKKSFQGTFWSVRTHR